ncbi:branched-chain amino acid ABC transporter permease [Pantoea rodasii]|uniref:Branched-chain amino acid ABC transporter permease n=1 Tax=Pantoea rodasii TaxID=1076549 RepID=A0A2M9WEC7_9GAMM|nr:ABC transporter permease [Pantoea rodasii]PJZ05895.1 branched-chain amino acid ABC transporter permease [Pantoea rodasii]
MSELTLQPQSKQQRQARVLRGLIVFTFIALLLIFILGAPGFATLSNIRSVMLNNVAPLAIVALAMTLVTRIGAIDLSVGTAIDVACLVFVTLILHQYSLPLALMLALLAALLVGVFNAILVTQLGVEPFLATLGTLFIGQSVQQLSSNGGQPIYLLSQTLPDGFSAIGHGALLGIPLPLWMLLLVALALYQLLHRSATGRALSVMGEQYSVALHSGIAVKRLTAWAFVLSALIAGVVGLILAANVKAWVPLSGNAYLLNAIGASFIGAAFAPSRRPNVIGTLLGVVFLSFIANGLLLIGWNFYWQQVATGVFIFIVLAVGALRNRRHA